MSSSLPPNPRDAKYRQSLLNWHSLPVTFFLMAICLLTAFYTKVGDESHRADFLFFKSQADAEEMRLLYNESIDELELIYDDESSLEDPAYLQQLAKIRELNEAFEKANTQANVFEEIKAGQVWRLFTPMFLHFGFVHLLFNLYWLWTFGAVLEIRYRPLKFLLIVIAVSIVSNVSEALLSGTSFGGMSGVNYGLFGFLFLHGRFHPSPYFQLQKQTIGLMLVWLVICFTGAVGPVANWAHLFGFLSGAILGFVNAMMAGGAKQMKRRSEFKRAISSANSLALHECAVCGITEKSDPEMEFRVLADGKEYCAKHLPEGHSL
jgi:membrane associated rhomboid family serine protease